MEKVFDERWSTALKSLYKSVVKEENYVDFLDQVQSLTQARFLILGMFDPHNRQHVHRFAAPSAIGTAGAAEYLALAAQSHEDGMRKMLSAGPQNVVLDIDVYDNLEQLEDLPTMKHLREKYAANHIASVNAQPNNAWVDYVMLAHDDAPYKNPEAVRASIEYFVPHIGVASEIRRAFTLLEERYKAIFAALDYLRYGVALVLDTGEMLLSNSAFDRIVETRTGLRLTGDRKLVANSEESNAQFQTTLAETLQAAKGEQPNYRKTIAIDRADSLTPFILDFVPFCDDIAGELNVKVEGALLFMVNPENPAILSHDGLSAAFQFTPAETKVCRQVMDGYSNMDIADANDVTLPTVKSQVSAIFSKTRVTNRSGLMRLASKVTPPLKEPE